MNQIESQLDNPWDILAFRLAIDPSVRNRCVAPYTDPSHLCALNLFCWLVRYPQELNRCFRDGESLQNQLFHTQYLLKQWDAMWDQHRKQCHTFY